MRDDEKLTAKSHSVSHDAAVCVIMPMFQCDCLLFLVDVIFSYIRLDETKLSRLLESCSKYIPIPNQIPTTTNHTQQKSELKSSSYAMHGCIPVWIVIVWVNNTPQQRGQLTWVSYAFNYVTAHQPNVYKCIQRACFSINLEQQQLQIYKVSSGMTII